MRYSVWSRGRLIGETDLGYYRIINRSRSGSFHPNSEGEQLMPVIASVLPAMRAYLHRDQVDPQGQSLVQPEMHGSTMFADLAEVFQRMHSLELELRREDGSVVPTVDIGIQDCEQLLEFSGLESHRIEIGEVDGDDDLFETTEYDPELEASIAHDAELIEEGFGEHVDDPLPESQREPFPRYQIHVLLTHDDAIP